MLNCAAHGQERSENIMPESPSGQGGTELGVSNEEEDEYDRGETRFADDDLVEGW